MAAAAISGSFADFKIIKSRGVAQIVVEIDLRNADAALTALGGVPQPASERPVAIARLAADKPAPEKRAAYADRSEGDQAVVRAGILCGDGEFQAWVGARDHDHAVQMMRDYCGVTSRRQIAESADALAKFKQIESDFKRRVPYDR